MPTVDPDTCNVTKWITNIFVENKTLVVFKANDPQVMEIQIFSCLSAMGNHVLLSIVTAGNSMSTLPLNCFTNYKQ